MVVAWQGKPYLGEAIFICDVEQWQIHEHCIVVLSPNSV